MKQENDKHVRVVRVSRLFGHHPASVLIHTNDGQRKEIKITDWDHINPDTGCITKAGWNFIDTELERTFGVVVWDTNA